MAAVIQQSPVFIDIRKPPESELAQLADLLIGTLGIAGILALVALIFGAAIGSLVFWVRFRS